MPMEPAKQKRDKRRHSITRGPSISSGTFQHPSMQRAKSHDGGQVRVLVAGLGRGGTSGAEQALGRAEIVGPQVPRPYQQHRVLLAGVLAVWCARAIPSLEPMEPPLHLTNAQEPPSGSLFLCAPFQRVCGADRHPCRDKGAACLPRWACMCACICNIAQRTTCLSP